MPARSKRKNLIYLLIFTCFFVMCLPFVLLYSLGYDLGKNFSLFKTGGIYIYTSESGAEIFIDEELNETSSLFQRGILVKQLSPDQYHIRVSKEGYLDWKKNISVEGEKVSEAYPILIPRSPKLTDIPKQIHKTSATTSPLIDNPEYATNLALFLPELEGEQTTAMFATSTSVETAKIVAEKEGNILRIFWKGAPDRIPPYFCVGEIATCKSDFVAYSSKSMGTLQFYPERDDVMLLVTENKLLAVELDMRPTQNIIPVYVSKTGEPIDFRIVDNETLVIKEGETLTELKLVYEK